MCGWNQYIVYGDDERLLQEKEYLGATGSLHILSIALAISLIGGLIGNVFFASGNGGKNMPYRMCDFGDGKYYTESFIYSKVWYYCCRSLRLLFQN